MSSERILSGLSASCSFARTACIGRIGSIHNFPTRLGLARQRRPLVVAVSSKQTQRPSSNSRPQGGKSAPAGPKQASKGNRADQGAQSRGKQALPGQRSGQRGSPVAARVAPAKGAQTTSTGAHSQAESTAPLAAATLAAATAPEAAPTTAARPMPAQQDAAASATHTAETQGGANNATSVQAPSQLDTGLQSAAPPRDAAARPDGALAGHYKNTGGANADDVSDNASGGDTDGATLLDDSSESKDVESFDVLDDEDGIYDDDDGEEVFPQMKLTLPNPTKVKVKTAEYLRSCVKVSDCPPPRFPEFTVIGRSNVGKSSLINMMTGRRDLAMVSKQPGKTKCINHFLINNSWYLVDLPGYGFAKVGLKGRQHFDAFTRDYFKNRPNLAMVLLLVDASIPPQPIDLEYANWLTDNGVPFALIFTKADKRRKGLTPEIRDSHVTAFKRALLQDLAYLPPSLLTSSAKGLGRGQLMNLIAGLRAAFENSGRLEAIRQGML